MDHPSYRLAYKDADFMSQEDLRPLRLEMELLKPEMILDELGIKSTIVIFGGTQVAPREEGEQMLADAEEAIKASPDDHQAQRQLIRAKRVLAKSRYYEECREFAKLVTNYNKQFRDGEFIVKTGGGPGIMEAGNRGAYERKIDGTQHPPALRTNPKLVHHSRNVLPVQLLRHSQNALFATRQSVDLFPRWFWNAG